MSWSTPSRIRRASTRPWLSRTRSRSGMGLGNLAARPVRGRRGCPRRRSVRPRAGRTVRGRPSGLVPRSPEDQATTPPQGFPAAGRRDSERARARRSAGRRRPAPTDGPGPRAGGRLMEFQRRSLPTTIKTLDGEKPAPTEAEIDQMLFDWSSVGAAGPSPPRPPKPPSRPRPSYATRPASWAYPSRHHDRERPNGSATTCSTF